MPRKIPAAAAGEKPQALKDPCNDRPVKEAKLPFAQLLSSDVLFSKDVPDIDLLKSHLLLEGALSQELLLEIIKKASELFAKEPNLLKLNDPITVVGDVHGQFYDLVKLLEVGGCPAEGQYVFLGDYVDRGSFSIETVALLFCLKIAHPKRVRMLRGNHECRQMTSYFNFREECEYKYDEGVYNAFMDAFDTLPLAAKINGKFLVVHGGLSPQLSSVKALGGIDRFQEPPREGLLCDLLWSDPYDKDDADRGKRVREQFLPNAARGCSFFYTFDCVNKFLQKNGLLSIVRAHEAQVEGYKMHKPNPTTGFPSVITIFSAPNYCDFYDNKGAILKFENSTLNVLQYNCAPHPYHLPNFMDVFTWSMPFVTEKVTEMFFYVLQPTASEAAVEERLPEIPEALKAHYRASLTEDQNKAVLLANQLASQAEAQTGGGGSDGELDSKERMRRKIRTVAKMARMFKSKRQENELVLKFKGACPGHRLEAGLLLASKDKAISTGERFELVAGVDVENEKRPDLKEEISTPATDVRKLIPSSKDKPATPQE